MNDAQIKHMVDRFLMWRLPENFSPDAGITFKAEFNEHTDHPMKHAPVGTNLLDAIQAEAMVRHMVDGKPEADAAIREMAAAEYRSCLQLSQYFLAGDKTSDKHDEADLAEAIQGAIDGWFSERENKAEAAWEQQQQSLMASGGPDDSSYRRDMINAGRGHLLR